MDVPSGNCSKHKMSIKRLYYLIGASIVIMVLWKLSVIQSDLEKSHMCQDLLNDKKHLNNQQELLVKQLEALYHSSSNNAKNGNKPIIYCITPTYWRYVQKAELTRIWQTLKLVSNVHWIVIEDAAVKSDLVRNVIEESELIATHLIAQTAPKEKSKDKNSKIKRHRGVEQRNIALKWLRDHLTVGKDRGVVYFMDDDNTYSIKLFDEIAKVKKVGVWPVGLVGGLNAELPLIDTKTGKVTGYKSGWLANRPFAIDMAGFAINLDLILAKPEANFSYDMAVGMQESEFLSYFIKKDELEPLADNCTKVYVWHTRTEKPKVSGNVPGLEV